LQPSLVSLDIFTDFTDHLAGGFGWLLSWFAPMPWWAGAVLEIPILVGLYLVFIRSRK